MSSSHSGNRFRLAVLGVMVGALVGGTQLGASALAAGSTALDESASSTETVWYLALGDSLSVGFQPNKSETDKGYVDNLAGRVREHIPSLGLRNVGCAGETSKALITGVHSPCSYRAGSQLDAAVAFLERHSGRVGFITIDIGSNDFVKRCLHERTGLLGQECATEQSPRLQKRVADIVAALRSAAGPHVPILGMNYYNPFLGFWGLVPGGRSLARADQRAWAVFDAGLDSAYENAGAIVADVATTFRIDDFEDTTVLPDGREVPLNVALACTWTWFCTPRFAGDPHANTEGYRKIGRTFYHELVALVCAQDSQTRHRRAA